MLKNPFLNSICAAVYIIFIVFVMNALGHTISLQKTLLLPMIMLGLFVLSAAVMAVLFFYRPIRMYLDGSKKEAVVFFGKTLLTFACLVLVFLVSILALK